MICLIANLMEQLRIDNTVDIYHQARKIAYSCAAFQSEVGERRVPFFLLNGIDLGGIQKYL